MKTIREKENKFTKYFGQESSLDSRTKGFIENLEQEIKYFCLSDLYLVYDSKYHPYFDDKNERYFLDLLP